MARWLLGALGAAVAMFLWGFVFWGLLGGAGALRTLPNEDAVRDALQGGALATGTYFLPAMVPGQPPPERGPIVKIYYQADGVFPMTPARMGTGFLHLWLAALLAGGLLSLVAAPLGSYGRRVGFVLLLGLFAAFVIPVGDAIWWHHPLAFQLTQFAYHAVGWLLAGLVLAWAVRGPLGAR